MSRKKYPITTVTLDKIVGGGQTLGTMDDGRKLFVWGGLPDETVDVQITKRKSSYAEGYVVNVIKPSPDRIKPQDPDSYLSTSPWQIMTLEAEQHYKAALIEEAFELHNIVLPDPIQVYTDGQSYHYRNKVEFSWYSQTDAISGVDTLDLAFFRRGSKGKIIVDSCSLLPDKIMQTAENIRDILHQASISAKQLKTLLIRSDQSGNQVWQLYIKDETFNTQIPELQKIGQGGEIIYSNPQSPASVITKRLAKFDNPVLTDTILDIPFRYATEGFFQINLPVYQQTLRDMKSWITNNDTTTPETVDLYSGVGTIGLTIGGPGVTLVEINQHAVREMKRNIDELNIKANPVLAASENALDYISKDKIIIVDPPRAGLHDAVIQRLLQIQPPRIVYLSCNPVTQARDVAKLATAYGIRHHQGYNFFPRTPHIEHLVVLDLKNNPR